MRRDDGAEGAGRWRRCRFTAEVVCPRARRPTGRRRAFEAGEPGVEGADAGAGHAAPSRADAPSDPAGDRPS